MPIFTDKAGTRHYVRDFIDVVEAPGGLEVGIICKLMPDGKVYAINVVATLDTVVKAFRTETLALAGLGTIDGQGMVQ